MTLTVAQVLELDVVQRAHPEVVVGGPGLNRPVRWVHISDYPDIAASLRGGELLLTSGLRLADNADRQARFVSELADVGVAAIVLESGEVFRQVPETLRSVAAQRDVPVILLRTPTPYVDITERVHTALINSHHEALEHSQRVSCDLTELVLDGARPRQIVQRLSAALRNPVMLEDAAHHLVEHSAYGRSVERIVLDWSMHSRRGHSESDRIGPASAADEQRCAWAPITARNQVWGRLHVLEVDTHFDEITELLLDRGAATIGLTLLAERESADWAEQARSALIEDILGGSYSSEDDLIARARQVGMRLQSGEVVALAAEVTREKLSTSQTAAARSRTALLAATRAALVASKASGVCAAVGGRVLALAATSIADNGTPRELARDLASAVVERVQHVVPNQAIVIGACTEVSVVGIRQAIERAVLALRYGLLTDWHTSGLYDFADLGFAQLLFRLSDGPELALLVEAELGPLLAHDATVRGDLAGTLRVVLAAPSGSAAARALHIERRSLYHRLERVRELLGCDITDPETRVRLTVALEALNFLRLRHECSMPVVGD